MNEYGLFHLPLTQYVYQSIQAVMRRRTEIGHHNSRAVRTFVCCQQFGLTIVIFNFLSNGGWGWGEGREGTKGSLGILVLLDLLCH